MSLLTRLWYPSRLQRWRRLLAQVEHWDQTYSELPDDEITRQSRSLRYRALSDEPLEQLLTTAYGLVRQAAGRVLGMKHYPVQILGGISLHYGSVAVMQTGEGKTLTATLPLYLAALGRRGSHLITANDYLAQRDSEQMRPLFGLLGMTVGVVTSESSAAARQAAYACDVTYSTAKEVGFDFLRDRLAIRESVRGPGNASITGPSITGPSPQSTGAGQVQRELHFALIDEADSILIDEARTPLIVSAPIPDSENPQAELYRWAAKHVRSFAFPDDAELQVQKRRVVLTASGRQKTRRLPREGMLLKVPLIECYRFLEQAIAVEQFYQDGRQYLIQNGEVQIVDEFTGRVTEGRKWRSGLHQAIEARHGLKVTCETGEAARVTIQDLFLRYERLAGMTGTVANSGQELHTIYRLHALEIPTNRPPQRQRLPDRVLQNSDLKWRAIADEVAEVHQSGRPVLVGTRSVEFSQILSKHLSGRGILHQVLNATQAAGEAAIVAQAGQVSTVTVATNMAGRGTDIQLSEQARTLGGLHVICSELHESARIDRQLIGRCGRQGDPGSYRHYHCWEDEILMAGFGERAAEWRTIGRKGQTPRVSERVFRQAQKRVERRHFKLRCQLLYQEGYRQQLQREMGQDPYLDTVDVA
jgi:preprotein translocase subunit SecA